MKDVLFLLTRKLDLCRTGFSCSGAKYLVKANHKALILQF